LALALATGHTIQAAAASAGLSESTAYRRLRSAAFRKKLDHTRCEIVGRAVGRLVALADAAADSLATLLQSESEKTRLGAARTVYEFLFRGHAQEDLRRQQEEQAEALRRRMDRVRKKVEAVQRTAAQGGSPAGLFPKARAGVGTSGDGEAVRPPAPDAGGDDDQGGGGLLSGDVPHLDLYADRAR
jgi:hypothetical protein